MTLKEAGQQYLDIVRPANEDIDAFSEVWDAAVKSDDWEALVEIAARWGPSTRKFVDKLVAAEWPDDIQPYVDDLVGDTADDIVFYFELSKATTWEEFDAAWANNVDFSNASAQALRIHLGLGNVGEDG